MDISCECVGCRFELIWCRENQPTKFYSLFGTAMGLAGFGPVIKIEIGHYFLHPCKISSYTPTFFAIP